MVTGIEAIQYAGVSARVRGMRSRLMAADMWEPLIQAETYDEAVSLLARTDYADAAANLGASGGNLERAERVLLGRAASDCRKAMSMLRGGAKVMLQTWWQHFEIENLKAVFRGVHLGIAAGRISEYLIPLEGFSKLPWQGLLHERTISGLVDRLRGSRYINPLLNAYPSYQRENNIFYLEVAVDVRYYRDIAVGIAGLGRGDQEQARRVLATHVDMLNLLWAYRYRVYYHLSVEEIVNYTIWHTWRTNVDLVRDIALGASPIEIVERLWGPDTVDTTALSAFDHEDHMLPRLETELKRYWRRLALQQMRGYPFGLGGILGYLVVAELEATDIITILEAKRLDWSPDLIRDHLVWTEE